jgi:hypothetical protein
MSCVAPISGNKLAHAPIELVASELVFRRGTATVQYLGSLSHVVILEKVRSTSFMLIRLSPMPRKTAALRLPSPSRAEESSSSSLNFGMRIACLRQARSCQLHLVQEPGQGITARWGTTDRPQAAACLNTPPSYPLTCCPEQVL